MKKAGAPEASANAALILVQVAADHVRIGKKLVRVSFCTLPKWCRDAFPEFLQFVDTRLRRVSGNESSVDRPDGDSRNPIRVEIGLSQRLVDSRLVGTERTPALQHQCNLLERRTGPGAMGLVLLSRFQGRHDAVPHLIECARTQPTPLQQCGLAIEHDTRLYPWRTTGTPASSVDSRQMCSNLC